MENSSSKKRVSEHLDHCGSDEYGDMTPQGHMPVVKASMEKNYSDKQAQVLPGECGVDVTPEPIISVQP